MTVWELAACGEGYARAHSPEEKPLDPPTPEEFEALIENARNLANRAG